MGGRPWYAFYPDAYERDAGSLSYVEDSAYRRMLDVYYKTGEPLPLNHDEIFRSCKAMKRDERAAILKCLGLFFVAGDDGYHQLRCDEEIVKAAELSLKRANAASKRHAKAHAIADASAEQLETHSTATSTEEEKSKKVDAAAGASASKPSTKGTRWPADQKVPEEWFPLIAEQFRELGRAPPDFRLEAVRFANHWSAKTGKDATKIDWQKTFSNWCLNARQTPGNSSPKRPATDQHMAGIADLASELRQRRSA